MRRLSLTPRPPAPILPVNDRTRRILDPHHPDPASSGSDVLDGYDLDAQVGLLLRRVHQRHAALFADGMAGADMTPTQFNALVRITQNHRVATGPATIPGIVRRLAARGLVRRRPDPPDRCTIVLHPTPDDLALAAAVAPLRPAEPRQPMHLLRKVA